MFTTAFWSTAAPAVAAAFLASLVEFVEALTIVLAVGTVRGWRPALLGAGLGILVLGALVAAFGPLLGQIPIHILQLVVGILLLLFGMRWLRKAILRSAGVIALHDEAAEYEAQTRRMKATGFAGAAFADPVAVATTFKAVVLEGIEVAFIVIAVGTAGDRIVPASLGAAAAGVLVLVLGVVLHRPLTRVPENLLKFAVGILISAFGVFWVSEGLGFYVPGDDVAIVAFAALLLASSIAAVRVATDRRAVR